MENEKPVIYYTQRHYTGFVFKEHLQIFSNGLVKQYESNNRGIEKNIKERNIGTEKVKEYIDRLTSIGFQNFEPAYQSEDKRSVTDEELTLNYHNHNKSVKFNNNYGSEQLETIVKELTQIMRQKV